MNRKHKIIIALFLALAAVLYFDARSFTFALECLRANDDLADNFVIHQTAFNDLIKLTEDVPTIDFSLYAKDSIYISFHDSLEIPTVLFGDNHYFIEANSTAQFRVNRKGCLEVIETGTRVICDPYWKVTFLGHFKDSRIDELIHYYGWSRDRFDQIVEKVQELDCHHFTNQASHFSLEHRTISYYKDGINHCFGHSDGYFGYLYARQPEKLDNDLSLIHLENNYFRVESWNF